MSCGFDAGTFNLIRSRRGEDGKVECVREVNAFIRIPLEDPFTYKMLEKCNVPLIERRDHAFAVGERAIGLARTFGDAELRRPMSGGCLNPREKDGYSILATMIHSMIGDLAKDGEVLCYSVPSNALNAETDVEYHQEVLKQIFSKYSVNGKKVQPYPINEARALIYAELQDKFLTGIGISFGAGMTNLCFANRSRPAFQFSLVNCGDWIDRQSAKAAAVNEVTINKEKERIDLLAEPKNEVERAIQTQYRILVRNTVAGIRDGLEGVKDKVPDEPIDIVLAGGTASPPGFDVLFRRAVDDLGLPIAVGKIKRPDDHLYAVARGCLEAAEAAEG